MRGGHRNMYYATGLPGWMRLGYSPGCVGRNPGRLPLNIQYLRTGTRTNGNTPGSMAGNANWYTSHPSATGALYARIPVSDA